MRRFRKNFTSNFLPLFKGLSEPKQISVHSGLSLREDKREKASFKTQIPRDPGDLRFFE